MLISTASSAFAGSCVGGQDPHYIDLVRARFDRAGLAPETVADSENGPTVTATDHYGALVRDSFVRAGMTVPPEAPCY